MIQLILRKPLLTVIVRAPARSRVVPTGSEFSALVAIDGVDPPLGGDLDFSQPGNPLFNVID